MASCDGSYYDVETGTQGVIYSIAAVCYIVLEAILSYYTISMCRKNGKMVQSLEVATFLVTMHISVLRLAIYFAAGVWFCTGEAMYRILSNFASVFRKLAFMAVIIRMARTARAMRDLVMNLTAVDIVLWVFALVDFVVFTLLFFFTHQQTGSATNVRQWYNLATNLVQLLLYIYYSLALSAAIKAGMTSHFEGQLFSFKIFIWIMCISFGERIAQTVFILMDDGVVVGVYAQYMTFTLYSVLHTCLTDYIPCCLIIQIMIAAIARSPAAESSKYDSLKS